MLVIKPFVNPVSTSLNAVRFSFKAAVSDPIGSLVKTTLYTISSSIQPVFDPVTTAVKAFIYPVTAPIKSIIDPLTPLLKTILDNVTLVCIFGKNCSC